MLRAVRVCDLQVFQIAAAVDLANRTQHVMHGVKVRGSFPVWAFLRDLESLRGSRKAGCEE